MKILLYITCILLILINITNCGKKGELEKPGKNYPKEYPSE